MPWWYRGSVGPLDRRGRSPISPAFLGWRSWEFWLMMATLFCMTLSWSTRGSVDTTILSGIGNQSSVRRTQHQLSATMPLLLLKKRVCNGGQRWKGQVMWSKKRLTMEFIGDKRFLHWQTSLSVLTTGTSNRQRKCLEGNDAAQPWIWEYQQARGTYFLWLISRFSALLPRRG